jgi:hypothetical protein
MTKLLMALPLLATAACSPTCIVVPGPDVEPGQYEVVEFWVFPDSVPVAGLPYSDAEDLTIELSPDRSQLFMRYVRGGQEVEELWSVRIP